MANGADPLDQTINPLYPSDAGVEGVPPSPRTQYNQLTSGLPPMGAGGQYASVTPRTASAQPPQPAGNVGAAQTPPMMPIHDYTQQTGFGSKYGRYNTNPIGLVIHHTAGRVENMDQMVKIYQKSGNPPNFTIMRDGTIYQNIPNGYQGRHIIGGTGLLGQGRSNGNMEGVELVANDDKDITPQQETAVANLAAQRGAMWNYNPITSDFGHGELNPPPVNQQTGQLGTAHRQPSEGETVTAGFRNGSIPVPDYSSQIRAVHITPQPGVPIPALANPSQYPASIPVAPGPTDARVIPGYVRSQDGKTWQRADTVDQQTAQANGVWVPAQGQQPYAPTWRPTSQGSIGQQPTPAQADPRQTYQILSQNPMATPDLPNPAQSLSVPPNWLTQPQQNMDPNAMPDITPGGAM